MVNIFVFQFATLSTQNETGLARWRSRWENLDRGQYRFQPIIFVNSVVPSLCETQPYNKKIYNARAQLSFCSLSLLFGDVLVAVVVVVCLSSLLLCKYAKLIIERPIKLKVFIFIFIGFKHQKTTNAVFVLFF